ncbi:hypothetical protein CAEBREN_00239 [Caenorhabditis brenneri]|uniref:Uncharacterized protein n=1 Tax=Caenorhabditis brenneri TaxID=135651 RepID=G0MY69_CAEBE|nr:hypothetical protein CAEBREN_00239 [Caenorhabditis brenneri]
MCFRAENRLEFFSLEFQKILIKRYYIHYVLMRV